MRAAMPEGKQDLVHQHVYGSCTCVRYVLYVLYVLYVCRVITPAPDKLVLFIRVRSDPVRFRICQLNYIMRVPLEFVTRFSGLSAIFGSATKYTK